MREFGARLAKARKAAGFTQRQVASRLDVCTASVSNWESGNNYPTVEMIPTICKMLGIDPNYLFGLNDQDAGAKIPMALEQVRLLKGKPIFLQVAWGEKTEYNYTGWGVIHEVDDFSFEVEFNGKCYVLLHRWYANHSEQITWQAYRTSL